MAKCNIEDNIRSFNNKFGWFYNKPPKTQNKEWVKIDVALLQEITLKKEGFQIYLTEKDLQDNKIEILSIQDKRKDMTDDLILSVEILKDTEDKKQYYYKINTGNYVGIINHNNHIYNIGSRFNNIFLNRMLRVANDVFIDINSALFSSQKDKRKDDNIVEYILYHSFLQSFLIADTLGIPKQYNYKHEENDIFRGRLDIPTHINKNMPFKGKFSLIYGEQEFYKPILHTLYWALRIMKERTFFSNNNNFNKLYSKYKLLVDNDFKIDINLLERAKQSNLLNNPIYFQYKKTLLFAEKIIKMDYNFSTEEKQDVSGYLLNISQLWEIYLAKLLNRGLSDSDWSVSTQTEIELYKNQFYKRKIIPDIVLTNSAGKVVVLDAKYKRMKQRGTNEGIWDLDRDDFFQIHTYMSYYKENLIAGGLLYPFESKLDEGKCHSENWIGGDAKFIIDGIDLEKIENIEQLIKSENEFIERIQEIL